MAKVQLGRLREQPRHYGLYKQASPTGDLTVVRRKVADPLDYQHDYSQKVKRQREAFAQASIHYSHLTSRQRQELKNQVEEVEYIRGHGKTDIKLLQGRALFISKDIHSLTLTHMPQELPGEICIILTDEYANPIPGSLLLHYYTDGDLVSHYPLEITPSNFIFRDIPPAAHDIYFYALSWGYYDINRWLLKRWSLPQLSKIHYYRLRRGYMSYSFHYGVWAWIQGWAPTFSFTINTCHWQTYIWSLAYEGWLGIGLRDYSGDRPKGEFVFEEWHYLSPAQPQPKFIDFTKYNLNLKPGKWNYLRSTRLDPWPADVMLPIHFCHEFQP